MQASVQANVDASVRAKPEGAREMGADMRLLVEDVFEETPLVRGLVLAAIDGGPLPEAEPGAHLRVRLPGDYDDRHYSLVDLPGRADARHYVLGVRLDAHSKGGSRFMHNLTRGDKIWVDGPRQSFPLASDEAPALLIAGGIGITPLLSMASRMAGQGRDFALHYAGRRRGALAFLEPLRSICGRRLHEHYDDDPETRLDIAAALDAADPTGHLYVCGPAGMIEAVRTLAEARGWAPTHVHFELFAAPAAETVNTPFDVTLARSKRTLTVPADRSLLAVLREAGVECESDCERGGCGMCRVVVLEGEPDHRDVILTKRERIAGTAMQACVSRARTPSLVLDL